MEHEKKVFYVYTNTDLIEGRGTEYIKHVCETYETAERLAKGIYVQGTDGRIKEGKIIFQDGKWWQYCGYIQKPNKEDVRKGQETDKFQEVVSKYNISEDDKKTLIEIAKKLHRPL